VVALRDVSLDIVPGELHAVVGENGAGKSTLMRCLSGEINDYQGDLLVRGQTVRFRDTAESERSGIGIIHQELNLVDELSAAANIFLGREKRGRLGLLDDRAMERAAGELLGQLECDVAPRQRVGQLRVGDQQLVEIAKALSLAAGILIMDEPTSALTDAEAARLFRVIERLRGRGVTVLYISHKMDEVFRLADRITVLRDGQLVRTIARAETTPREITHLMVGREIEETDLRQPRTPGDVVLQVRGLSLPRAGVQGDGPGFRGRSGAFFPSMRSAAKMGLSPSTPGYVNRWRLHDINFTLRRGEILGLAGLMGAGRTELLECLFGCGPQTPQGEILLEGRPAVFRRPAQAMRAGIALVTEDRKRLGLFANLDVGRNISICTLDEVTRLGWIRSGREHAMARQAADELGVKMPDLAAALTSLSGGNQQKAIVARWLLTQPKVLLLDDPTRGVDVGAKADLYRIMDRLCREGMGIILTSSELPELLALCDRILVLCEGRATGELCRAEATEQRIMELATQRGPGSRSINTDCGDRSQDSDAAR
jgi:ABC-type sugar transport system ATPase subunit